MRNCSPTNVVILVLSHALPCCNIYIYSFCSSRKIQHNHAPSLCYDYLVIISKVKTSTATNGFSIKSPSLLYYFITLLQEWEQIHWPIGSSIFCGFCGCSGVKGHAVDGEKQMAAEELKQMRSNLSSLAIGQRSKGIQPLVLQAEQLSELCWRFTERRNVKVGQVGGEISRERRL